MTHRTAKKPLAWVMNRSTSCFVPVIDRRCAAEDRPEEPVRLLAFGRDWFAHVEWPDGRWLVLPLNCRPAQGAVR